MNNDLKKFYSRKRILITGGRGYLASNLTEVLKDISCQIIRLDKSDVQFKEGKTKAEIKDITCDIRKSELWESVLDGVDIVFHFAGQTSLYVANESSVDDFTINVLPLLHLLETCRKNKWKPNVLFSGTVTEIGLPIKLPVDESHPDKPVSIYDLHKLIAEKYLKYYSDQGIIKGVILRLANVYGPGPKSSSADRGILNMMTRKALKGEDLTLYGKGHNLRDYIYVKDVVNAFLVAGMYINDLNGQHFVIGSGKSHTLNDAFRLVVKCVKRETGRMVKIVNVDPPNSQSPIDNRNFAAKTTRFCKATGWLPNVQLEEGINHTINWLLNDVSDKIV